MKIKFRIIFNEEKKIEVYQVAPWFCNPHKLVSFLGGGGFSVDFIVVVWWEATYINHRKEN